MLKNKEFKSRLKDSCFGLLAIVVALAITLAVMFGIVALVYGLSLIHKDLSSWLFFIGLGAFVVWQVGKWIKWQFIDPFKKDKGIEYKPIAASSIVMNENGITVTVNGQGKGPMGENDTDRNINN